VEHLVFLQLVDSLMVFLVVNHHFVHGFGFGVDRLLHHNGTHTCTHNYMDIRCCNHIDILVGIQDNLDNCQDNLDNRQDNHIDILVLFLRLPVLVLL
jgi:hypothetical protein